MAMVVLATWRWTGVSILYFLSGLQSIPTELYESAAMDGASPMQKFRHITMPMLKPTTIYVLTISIYGGFAMFTESYMLFAGKPVPGRHRPHDRRLPVPPGLGAEQPRVRFRGRLIPSDSCDDHQLNPAQVLWAV